MNLDFVTLRASLFCKIAHCTEESGIICIRYEVDNLVIVANG